MLCLKDLIEGTARIMYVLLVVSKCACLFTCLVMYLVLLLLALRASSPSSLSALKLTPSFGWKLADSYSGESHFFLEFALAVFFLAPS